MHQAVQNRVGQCRIPQGVMPVLHGQLTGYHLKNPWLKAHL